MRAFATLVALSALHLGCGPRAKPRAVAGDEGAAKVPPPDSPYRRPGMPWWHGKTPQCSAGALKALKADWGAVYWCELEGHTADATLQNDVGRVARCVHAASLVLGSVPSENHLGEYLSKVAALERPPAICSAIRRSDEVLTYNGKAISLNRALVESETDDGLSHIRYRFSCDTCAVASETVVRVKLP